MRTGNEWLHGVAALATSRKTGTFTARGEALVQALVTLREGHEDAFRVRFQPDATAAVESRDMPRLARVLLSFCEYLYLARAMDLEDRRRNSSSPIPLDTFCMRWHEASGGPTDRARYISDKEGGDYHSHLTRFYRNRRAVEDSRPPR